MSIKIPLRGPGTGKVPGIKKRTGRALLALGAFLSLALFAGRLPEGRALAGEAPLEGDIRLEASYGYEDAAKSGRFLPVKVDLENEGEEDFSGTLCVLAMESDYEFYQYEYPVEIGAGEGIKKELTISLGGRIDQMYIKVLDERGEEAAGKRLKLNVPADTAELFIGVLSGRPDHLRYLNGVGLNYGTLRTRLISMNGEEFPENSLELDQLDMLLITDFNSASLTKGQLDAVWGWVEKGGVLMLGGGGSAEKTLSAFEEELGMEPLPQPDLREVNMGQQFAREDPSGATIELECTDIYMKGAREVLSSDEVSVLTYVPKGNGMAAAAIYDFADIEEFCQENPDYVDWMMTQLLGEDKIVQLARTADGTASEQYWSVQSLINTGDINRLPRVGCYTVAAVAYVLLIGPGLYFFLKHRGLRSYYYLWVLAASLGGTGLVYLIGLPTRFKGPFFTYASVRDIDSGEVSETAFINMRSPNSRPFAVTLDPSYTVYPITQSVYYSNVPKPDFKGDEEPALTLRFEEEGTRIKAGGAGAFQSKYFKLERRQEGQEEQGFSGNIRFFDGQMTGHLTNHYPKALDDVAVLLYNQLVLVGRMEPGETVSLDSCQVVYGAANYGYVMAEQVTGASRYREGDMEDADYVRSLERTNLLAFYITDYMNSYQSEARIVGFEDENHGSGFLKGGGYETYGTTLVTSAAAVDSERDGMTYRYALPKAPQVLSGDYSAAGNTMYGTMPLILEYFLGNDPQVEKVEFTRQSDSVIDSLRYSYTVPFSGNIYFYNYNTGGYDLMGPGMDGYTGQELEPYLSPGNTLMVKYVYDSVEDYTWNIILPVVTVIGGSGQDAGNS